jgi:outer membrane porin, OprD family
MQGRGLRLELKIGSSATPQVSAMAGLQVVYRVQLKPRHLFDAREESSFSQNSNNSSDTGRPKRSGRMQPRLSPPDAARFKLGSDNSPESAMRLLGLNQGYCRSRISLRLLAAGWIAVWAGLFGVVTPSQAQSQFQRLLPDVDKEVADQDRFFWSIEKIPPQPYMNQVYWPHFLTETPAFFSESLLQFVSRTYYLTRDNSDGSRSQGWAGGGWLAFRSGLIGDVFGMQAAAYTSQPIFAPEDESGTKLLAPPQNSIRALGQIYGRAQFGDQEFRGGRQLVDTPLINAQDNRMLPNTFEAATIVSLPDKDRNYDYAVGYLWDMKQRDSNDFISMSDALAGSDVVNRGAPFAMLQYRPVSGLSLVAMDYNVQDFINTGFAQAEYDFKRPIGVPNWIIGANVTDQRSVGANLLTGRPFEPIKHLQR